MTVKLAANVRLAFREEGEEVVVYLAEPSTMEDAIVLARLNKGVLNLYPPLWEKVKTAYSQFLQAQVAIQTGVIPLMQEQVPPEPREGKA